MARVQSLSFSLRCLARQVKDCSFVRTNFQRNLVFYRSVHSSRFCSNSSEASAKPQAEPKTSTFTFCDRDGDKKSVTAKYGELLLDIAKNNDVDLEGACEGTLSCSTCHVIFDPEEFSKLDLPLPEDEELDMLDLAYELTSTSRLGCQVEVTDKFDGITVKIPEATRDARDL